MSRSRRVLTIVAAFVAVLLLLFGVALWRIKRHLPRWLAGETLVLQIDAGHHWRSYYVRRTAEVGGDDIADADEMRDAQTGRPEVNVAFAADAAKRFEELTAASVGRKLAIVLENVVNSAPVIESKIGGGH